VLRVGFVGWRGMVGSVLLDRMRGEGDLDGIQIDFFSTSNVGGRPPEGAASPHLKDAHAISELAQCEAVLTCQGGEYTATTYPRLRAAGWRGYWIDAASTLRLDEDATLALDPVNGAHMQRRLRDGCRTFVGANCTVSLLLMAIGGLFRAGLVEWVSTMTYQAVSGAGARKLQELAGQLQTLSGSCENLAGLPAVEIEKAVTAAQRSTELPVSEIGVPLACSVLPWIDREMEGGQTREEWKASVEATKILGAEPPVIIDGICARIDALRCHSQALCIKLSRVIPLGEVEGILRDANPWVRVIENTREATLAALTPAAVSGTLDIAVGRLRNLAMGPSYLGAFTVGDQLLWGAAEPLRRTLRILREHCESA